MSTLAIEKARDDYYYSKRFESDYVDLVDELFDENAEVVQEWWNENAWRYSPAEILKSVYDWELAVKHDFQFDMEDYLIDKVMEAWEAQREDV